MTSYCNDSILIVNVYINAHRIRKIAITLKKTNNTRTPKKPDWFGQDLAGPVKHGLSLYFTKHVKAWSGSMFCIKHQKPFMSFCLLHIITDYYYAAISIVDISVCVLRLPNFDYM